MELNLCQNVLHVISNQARAFPMIDCEGSGTVGPWRTAGLKCGKPCWRFSLSEPGFDEGYANLLAASDEHCILGRALTNALVTVFGSGAFDLLKDKQQTSLQLVSVTAHYFWVTRCVLFWRAALNLSSY